jgi:hypothetical protein
MFVSPLRAYKMGGATSLIVVLRLSPLQIKPSRNYGIAAEAV